MVRALKKFVRKGLCNVLGVDMVRAGFDEGWAEERDYLDRAFLLDTWGRHFRVFELRSHYRDRSHLICKREA